MCLMKVNIVYVNIQFPVESVQTQSIEYIHKIIARSEKQSFIAIDI